jgi:lysophospholipase L1-like esterase
VKSLGSASSGVRWLAAFAGIALVLGVASSPARALSAKAPPAHRARAQAAKPQDRWVASWTAGSMPGTSSVQASAGFSDQTVRNIIYPSVGGDSLRVQVSNTFGAAPLTVGAVSVGVVSDGAQLVPGTSHPLTFGGKTAVTIPAGAQALSDPLAVSVRPLEDLAVSLYLPDATGPATYHQVAGQTNYVAFGDHASDAAGGAYMTAGTSWFFVDGLDVSSATADGTVVAFGDSITDGYQAIPGSNDRWPNYLARRLDAQLGDRAPGVVDEGISGNRVLNDSSCYGASAETRFERDALGQPGVKAVIVLEGINDIGFAGELDTGCYVPNDSTVTAAEIETGYRKLIAMAHARGVKIYFGTLTPFSGSHTVYGGYYGTPYGETLREEVNNWIRTSGAFNGVIDFSAAVQDPSDPLYLNPAYNSGDSLHPGDLGYAAMANAVPLSFVR